MSIHCFFKHDFFEREKNEKQDFDGMNISTKKINIDHLKQCQTSNDSLPYQIDTNHDYPYQNL